MSNNEASYKYESIAVGGTFDRIHRGHRSLLDRAFATGRIVYVGLTSDEFVMSTGKKIENNFEDRHRALEYYIRSKYPSRSFEISKLEADFGPAMFTNKVGAIVVSEETSGKVASANKARRERGLPDLRVESVPLTLAYDGRRISSSRVRAGEIDTEGLTRR